MIDRLGTTVASWPTLGQVDNLNFACGLALKFLSLYGEGTTVMTANKWRVLAYTCMEVMCGPTPPFDMGIVKGVCNQGRLGREKT